MRYRYLVDLRRGISVFAIFSYGIAVLGTPQCPPPPEPTFSHSNLTPGMVDEEPLCGCATSKSLYFILNHIYIYR